MNQKFKCRENLTAFVKTESIIKTVVTGAKQNRLTDCEGVHMRLEDFLLENVLPYCVWLNVTLQLRKKYIRSVRRDVSLEIEILMYWVLSA